MEEARSILDDLKSGHVVRKLHKHLCRASQFLSTAWDHAQADSLTNAGVRYASVSTVYTSAQHHHHYHYGCEHGGLGQSLPTARVNHGTLQWPLVKVRMLTPHKRVGAQSSFPILLHLEEEILSQSVLIESDNTATVLYINK